MKHINLTNWHGSITDWTKLNYIYGGLDDTYAVKGNLRINNNNYNYVEYREGYNLFDVANATYSSGDNWNITTDFYLEAGKTYTIWTNETDHNLFTTGVAGWHSVKNVSTTITPSSSGYLMFGASDYNWYSNLASFKQLKIMVNSGSTALTYEPYFTGKKYVITENLKYVNVSEEILNNIDSLTFRSTTGGYEIGKDGGWLLETITGTATSPFTITNSNDVYNNSDNYVISNSWVSLPNTYDTKEKYIDYFTNNVIEAVVIKSTPVIEVVE